MNIIEIEKMKKVPCTWTTALMGQRYTEESERDLSLPHKQTERSNSNERMLYISFFSGPVALLVFYTFSALNVRFGLGNV